MRESLSRMSPAVLRYIWQRCRKSWIFFSWGKPTTIKLKSIHLYSLDSAATLKSRASRDATQAAGAGSLQARGLERTLAAILDMGVFLDEGGCVGELFLE